MNLISPTFLYSKSSSFLKNALVTASLVIVAMTLSSTVDAQKKSTVKPPLQRCGTMEAIQQQMISDPAFRARMQQGQADYQNSLRQPNSGQQNRPTAPGVPTTLPGPVTIPVVVHVVLPNPWIITDEQVEYFINRLNLDFPGINPDSVNGAPFYPVRGHSLLRFVLARRDIAGNFTTGVVRKIGTTLIQQTNNQPIKNSNTLTGGSTGWDISKYYNIYVGATDTTNPNGELLGISPGIGPGTAAGTPGQDGVCVSYKVFGPSCFSYAQFNMSRTSVHEIGHNFGLFHTFQGACNNQDFAQLTTAGCSLPANLLAPSDDTPPQSAATSGCPTTGALNGCTPSIPKMFQSFMDYSDDACYSMFSKGEVARMEWVLENCRAGYLTTLGGQYPANMQALDAGAYFLAAPGGSEYDPITCKSVIYPAQTCPGTFVPKLRITNAGTTPLTSVTVTTTMNGLNASTVVFPLNNLGTGKSQVVTLAPQTAVNGANALRFVLSAPNGGVDGNALNDTLTVPINIASTLPLPYVENFAATAFPPANGSSLSNPDGDVTWARTTLAARPAPGSMTIDMYNYNAIGERDIYRTPPVDLSTFDSLRISFYVAHQQYEDGTTPPTNDSLRIVYSPDCGATWYPTSYAKGGATLSTIPGAATSANAFVPTATQWRKETVVLKDFCTSGLKSIQIGFESYCDFGNNIYVDSINIVGSRSAKFNAKLEAIAEPAAALCTTGFSPKVTISNQGGDTLRKLQIKYYLDNNKGDTTASIYNWTGSLGKCGTTTVTLPATTTTIGSHSITAFITLPNDSTDLARSNDTLTKAFAVFTTAATPIVEGFENIAFPTTNWGIQNVNGGTTWERSTAAARTGTGALLMNNPNVTNSNGALDYYISPIVINNASFDSVFVDFDYAYRAGRQYPGSTVFPLDTLEVLATTDCGATFSSVWKKYGNELQTINDPNYTFVNSYVPRLAAEWKSNRLYLSPYIGNSNFQLYFAARGNKQNNVWIDNINISTKTLPQKLKDQGYLIYPNPFNNSFLIHHSAVEPPVDLQSVQVFNAAGQLVWEKRYNGNADRQITINMGNLSKGLYVLKMIYTNKTVVERIVKN